LVRFVTWGSSASRSRLAWLAGQGDNPFMPLLAQRAAKKTARSFDSFARRKEKAASSK
jgi:hypothetical protein